MPLGGINLANLKTWLDHELIAAVGGSWLAPRDVIRTKDWAKVEANAREAMVVVRKSFPMD